MDSRYLSTHTRYTTKEDERLKQERARDRQRRKIAPPHQQDSHSHVPSMCHGNACDTSLYSHEFQDDLVFGPAAHA